ncbi:MAG: NAD(P)-dependent oxidoreductase [candidate division Zixibacteria bacterium]|nr:NAD(P)-dependent oxidoreductase [candidate division Zixibacteria bacterium]
MKLLITGGAGFLGYHIANIIHRKGHQVELLDVADYPETDYPQEVVKHRCDIRNRDTLEKLIRENNYNAVVHCAAALPLWKKKDIVDTNVDGTRNVIEFSMKHGVERVVYISSTAVYGVPKKHPVYEHDPMIGVGTYGESKIKAEEICNQFREKGYFVPIVRPKTFIGTGRLGVFQILYDWVESGKRIPVIGNGKNHYQLLEVDDLVDAIYLCLIAPREKANDTFNVGATDFDSVEKDVNALCKHAGTSARVVRTPATAIKAALIFFEFIGLSPLYKWIYSTADKDSYVSVEKIEKELGWKPKISNAQALIKSYDWYLENEDQVNSAGAGVTHRVAWKQGILSLFKRIM